MTVYREDPQQDDGSDAPTAPQVHWSAVNPAGSAYGLFVLSDAFFDVLRPPQDSMFECYVHVRPCWTFCARKRKCIHAL